MQECVSLLASYRVTIKVTPSVHDRFFNLSVEKARGNMHRNTHGFGHRIALASEPECEIKNILDKAYLWVCLPFESSGQFLLKT
jgi:hypothetical protein